MTDEAPREGGLARIQDAGPENPSQPPFAAERDKAALRGEVTAALWRAADRLPYVLSATIAGSFASGGGICDVSDIDLIVVVDRLDGPRFAELGAAFQTELAPVLGAGTMPCG